MVSDLCGVILISFVITAELCASYQQNVESAIWYFPNNCRVHSRCQTGVFWENVWHGTQLLKPSATRRGMIFKCNVIVIMLWVCYMCYECDMDVLWMCYESVMSVMWALWKCYESVMKVLWKCYGCVMDVLWMCYGCVMDVWGMLWTC